jgi:hypothetical protein
MIDIKLIYELYTKELNDKLKNALSLKLSYTESYNNLQTLIKEYKAVIEKFSTITLEELFNSTSISTLNDLRFPLTVVYNNGKQIPFKVLRMYIEKYLECNKNINNATIEINKCKKELIPFTLYNKIISKCNNKIIDKIIEENYKAEPLKSFGSISVIRNYNEHRRINWGASNKLKAEIENRGGIAYNKEEELKAIAEGKEYTGEDWLVIHPFLDFYLEWHTKWISKKLNPVLRDYKYTPARGVVSIVSKLQKVKNDRDRALLLYTRTAKE